MVMCFVPNCNHYSERNSCSYFRFPKDEKLKKRWIRNIRRADQNPTSSARVCSCHFDSNSKEKIPTLFEWNWDKSMNFPSPEKRKRRKNRPAGLSIAPVNSKSFHAANSNLSASCVNTSSEMDTGHSDPMEPPEEDSNPIYCSKCKIFVSCGSQWCPTCNNKLSSPSPSDYKIQPMEPYVVTQNVTTTNGTVSKKIIFNHHDLLQQGNQSFRIQKNVIIKTGAVLQTSPRSKSRPKKRPREPVCLSSDEEEPTQEFNSYREETTSNIYIFPLESEGSKSDQSGPEIQEDEETKYIMNDFPGETYIHHEEEELFDDEEVSPEDIEGYSMQDQVIKCRCVRIGSCKIQSLLLDHIHVFLDSNSIWFCAPTLSEPCVMTNVMLKTSDITRVLVHFGRTLPLVFIHTTAAFGETLRKALGMVEGKTPYFDPTSSDVRQDKITLVIAELTKDNRRFLIEVFPGDQKVEKIDERTANEILVLSTPRTAPGPPSAH